MERRESDRHPSAEQLCKVERCPALGHLKFGDSIGTKVTCERCGRWFIRKPPGYVEHFR
jgi:hypothetical protein